MKKILLIFSVFLSVSLSAQQRVIAHRAGKSDFTENVLSSFVKSSAAGMSGFETDIRITADGQLVISHDGDLKRVFGKSGVVEDMTLAQVKQYRTADGDQVPTLDELLDFFKDKKDLYVEFEMKCSPEKYPHGLLEKYCDAVYEKVMAARPADATYIISTFDYRAIRYLTSKHPDQDCFMLIHGDPVNDKTMALAMSLGVKRIAVTLNGTSRRFVKEAHQKGITINLWPGSNVEDFILAKSLGADILCTDVPVEVMDFVKTKASWMEVKF